MYCQLCRERVYEEDSLKDPEGWHWTWDVQICPECSPKRVYTKEELEKALGIKLKDD